MKYPLFYPILKKYWLLYSTTVELGYKRDIKLVKRLDNFRDYLLVLQQEVEP